MQHHTHDIHAQADRILEHYQGEAMRRAQRADVILSIVACVILSLGLIALLLLFAIRFPLPV